MNTESVEEKLRKEILIIVNLLESANYNETIRKTIPLIKKFPNEYIFCNALALAHNGLGDFELALGVLSAGLKNDSNNIFLLNNMGLTHSNLGNFEKAEEYLKRALTISPFFLDASITYANLKIRSNGANEAIKVLSKVLDKYQKNYVIHFTLGDAYQQVGSFEKARTHFENCLKINPENCAPDKAISLITNYKKEDPHLEQMKLKFPKIKSIDNKILLGFAIGKALEDIKKFKDSFTFYNQANKLREQNGLNYDFNKDKKLFENIKNFFNDGSMKSTNSSDKRIIFIIGMTRSGTSLLEQILSSHNKVYGAGELSWVEKFIEKKFLKNNVEFIEEGSENIGIEMLKEMQENYFEKVEKLGFSENIIIDKAPLNFKWIGFLIKAFPNCKIIHSQRSPMDVCWSNYKNFFPSKALGFTYNLEDLGKFYLLYQDLMEYWESILKGKIYNIKYENLINDQEREVKNLLNYCNLEWDEGCMAFHKNKKPVATASLAQVRSPIYKSSVAKWENYSEELKGLSNILNT